MPTPRRGRYFTPDGLLRETRMIRYLFVAGLAAGLLWSGTHAVSAADEKTAPKEQPKDPQPVMGGVSQQTQKINEFILKGYEKAGIPKPTEKATDLEFMRRVFLDLLGRIPTVEE